MRLLIAGVSALAIAAAVTPAIAAGSAVRGLADLRQLNLIVTGNVTGNGQDTEGKAFIGGNSAGGSFNNADSHGPFVASAYPTLTVGGDVNGTVNLDNYNSSAPGSFGANIGGSGGTVNVNGKPSTLNVGGAVQTNVNSGQVYNHNVAGLQSSIATQTATFVSDLKALSTALAALPATAGSGFDISDPNNAKLTSGTGTGGFAVIDITADQLNAARSLIFSISKVGGVYVPTIINVTGATNYSINANSNPYDAEQSVLFNYVGATNISFNRGVDGSILAPLASISNSTAVEGSVAVANFYQGGEVHLGTFLGGGGADGGPTDPAHGLDVALGGDAGAVPEPASWALMLAGFGLAGAALRRRRIALAA